jgi:hypothetical protein
VDIQSEANLDAWVGVDLNHGDTHSI